MGRLNYMADLAAAGRLRALIEEIRAIYPIDPSTGKRTSLKKILLAYIIAPLEPYALKSWRKTRLSSAFPPPWMRRDFAASALPPGLPRAAGERFGTVYDQDNWEVLYYEVRCAALRYHDLASVGSGVETRFPLLDLALVEFMAQVPRERKLALGRVREIQTDAMRDFLPTAIFDNHLKKDYHPVLDAALRESYDRQIQRMLAKPERLSAHWIDWGHVEAYHGAYLAGRGKPYPVWLAIALERWLEMTY
jgi:asparagine synthase (glutamine-hydrolysing)